MTRVLVTGATGFTASYVVPLLKERGCEVHGLSSAACDIRDAAAVQEAVSSIRPEKVLHLAGTPNLPDSEADRAYTVNVQGTINLLEACARLSPRPTGIILASSCYVYGDTGALPAREKAPLRPTAAYGRSKVEMEYAARRWTKVLPIVIARPFNYTGVGHNENYLVPKLVHAFMRKDDEMSFVDPDIVRDFSDVRWVARAYMALVECGPPGAEINLCSGVGTRLSHLIDILQDLTGHTPRRRRAEGSKVTALVGQPDRLLNLGVALSPYRLEDTLRWMLASP